MPNVSLVFTYYTLSNRGEGVYGGNMVTGSLVVGFFFGLLIGIVIGHDAGSDGESNAGNFV